MTSRFSQLLLDWYDQHGRKDLPWQQYRTPYYTWLSEIMLQQTQVGTVIPYFHRFVKKFPDVVALANASLDEVMSMWAGLGYYARARNLHQCALIVHQQYQGRFPDTLEALEALPGIGRSTAGAIVSQAFDRPASILDGNVRRVLTRYRAIAGWPGKSDVQKQLWAIADELKPIHRSADYTQAIMDLGALVCTRRTPRCDICPVAQGCQAFHQGSPENYPEKRKGSKRTIREVTLLLCYQQQGEVMLERRPPAGIWGGLWSLPQCDPHQNPSDFLKQNYGYQMKTTTAVPSISHAFTHFEMRISPLWAQVAPTDHAIAEMDHRWCTLSDVGQLGMPRPVEGLVAKFFQSFG